MTIDYRSEFSLLCSAGVAVLWTSSEGLRCDLSEQIWWHVSGEHVRQVSVWWNVPASQPSGIHHMCFRMSKTALVHDRQQAYQRQRLSAGMTQACLTLTSPHLSSASCLQYSLTAGLGSRFQSESDAWVTGWPLHYPKPPRQPQSDEPRPRHHGNLGMWDVKGSFHSNLTLAYRVNSMRDPRAVWSSVFSLRSFQSISPSLAVMHTFSILIFPTQSSASLYSSFITRI